jgi:hypothetical protein
LTLVNDIVVQYPNRAARTTFNVFATIAERILYMIASVFFEFVLICFLLVLALFSFLLSRFLPASCALEPLRFKLPLWHALSVLLLALYY